MTASPPVEVVSGDPASCSALGGVLRRQAATLRDRRTALWHSATGLYGWTGDVADALTDRLHAQLAEVDRLALRLEEIGAALQIYATDLAHARARADEALDFVASNGLCLDNVGQVQPRRGPLAVEVALRRREAMPRAQHEVASARAEGRAAADRLRRRTAGPVQALRTDRRRSAPGPDAG